MSRIKRTAAVAAAGLAVSTLGLIGATSAQAVTSGNYCGATSTFAGDVYVQACISISGTNAYSYLQVADHGSNNTVNGTTWTNSRGVYEGYGSCTGLTNYTRSYCYGASVPIGNNNYAQGQGYVVINGVSYGTVYSPSEYVG